MDALPPSMSALIRSLERRVAVLERANKLLSSTITGGTLRVLDDDGDMVVELGLLSNGGKGISVATNDGANSVLLAEQDRGFARPWLSTTWKDPTIGKTITSGTFAEIFSTSTELLFSQEVLFRVRIIVDAATTGEAKVLIGGNQVGTTKTLSASTDLSHEYRAAHGLAMGGGPVGVSLQVRRASGAGNVVVVEPEPLHWGSAMGVVANGWV